MRCAVCGRRAEEEYCSIHKGAYKNVLRSYEEWKRAMDVGWEEYLKMLTENPNTGLWALEVCQHLTSKSKESKNPMRSPGNRR
ncbi:MAG: hypothetical protein ACE5Z5_06240 [Candidatus Bathyarchaeia archaeon]